MTLSNVQFSGTAFPLVGADPSHVRSEDISASLSKQCVLGGASRVFYSMAQHSVLCMLVAPYEAARLGHKLGESETMELQRAALLYRAHEGVMPAPTFATLTYMRQRAGERADAIRRIAEDMKLAAGDASAKSEGGTVFASMMRHLSGRLLALADSAYPADFDVLSASAAKTVRAAYKVEGATEQYESIVQCASVRMVATENFWLLRAPGRYECAGDELRARPFTMQEMTGVPGFTEQAWRQLFMTSWAHRTSRRVFEKASAYVNVADDFFRGEDGENAEHAKWADWLWSTSAPLRPGAA
jgi:hypothetical protein